MSMSDSQSEEQQIAYQEDEVIWAKVRGYPWWPAFVDKILPKNEGETEYTVYFFGDDTHSVLGASKLCKFCDHYTEFYAKAKTHKKLMQSIQKAEERLQQNDQNVEIFQTFRNSIKHKKRRLNNSGEKPISQYSSQQKKVKQNNISFSKQQNSLNESIPVNEIIIPRRYYYKQQSLLQQKSKIQPNTIQNQYIQQQKYRIKDNSEIISAQQIQQQQLQGILSQSFIDQAKAFLSQNQMIDNKHLQHLMYQLKGSSTPRMSQLEEQDHQFHNQSYENGNHQKVTNNGVGQNKKRGRPKKIKNQILAKEEKISIKPVQKHKLIKKVSKAETIQHIEKQKKVKNNSKNDQILNTVKQLLNNRQQLISYLNKIIITPANIKQILDLNVSLVIQKGPCTGAVINLLQIFKVTLLRKYFPEDLKYQKKYQRLVKKKSKLLHQEENKNEQNADEQDHKKEQSKQNMRDNIDEAKQTPNDPQIRKKTLNKLYKFLKRNGMAISQIRENAVKIQSFFEYYDSNISSKYRQMAFRVLSCLKMKELTVEEVLQKLESNQFE